MNQLSRLGVFKEFVLFRGPAPVSSVDPELVLVAPHVLLDGLGVVVEGAPGFLVQVAVRGDVSHHDLFKEGNVPLFAGVKCRSRLLS